MNNSETLGDIFVEMKAVLLRTFDAGRREGAAEVRRELSKMLSVDGSLLSETKRPVRAASRRNITDVLGALKTSRDGLSVHQICDVARKTSNSRISYASVRATLQRQQRIGTVTKNGPCWLIAPEPQTRPL